jgi:hypothetical protein
MGYTRAENYLQGLWKAFDKRGPMCMWYRTVSARGNPCSQISGLGVARSVYFVEGAEASHMQVVFLSFAYSFRTMQWAWSE